MESPSLVQKLSFRKNAREGQQAVFDEVQKGSKYLNIKLPTGYGKTFVCCGSYSLLKHQGRVNRLLVIFPSVSQLEQFKEGGSKDLEDASVDGNLAVYDVSYWGIKLINRHKRNEAQIFAITVQALTQPNGQTIVKELLASGGRWMLCVDEYHHYGIDAVWGKAVLSLPVEFTLAMSATPNRKDNDSAFGEPNIMVKYRNAVTEKAVKPLTSHSYVYTLDVQNKDGDVESFSTSELIAKAGGESSEKIDAFLITRKMRWSPKYVSPLVSIPLERMIRERVNTGFRLQAIVGAMSVSHAEMVCRQISEIFKDVLTVDWVGTGEDGRSNEDNKRILRKFCPPKDPLTGEREHTLDVLVHVGMAGEGLDSVDVSEVIHLNSASWNNSNDQENGRAARYRQGVTGHINFDSSSEYAIQGYLGEAIMDAMDQEKPKSEEQEKERSEPSEEYKELPEEPKIHIANIDLDHINSGDPEVIRMKKVITLNMPGLSVDDWKDENHWIHQVAVEHYKRMRKEEAEKMNPESIARQWQESVKNATSVVTHLAAKVVAQKSERFEKSMIGDIKKRINYRKKCDLGGVNNEVETCKQHYEWLKGLESTLQSGEVPKWLL